MIAVLAGMHPAIMRGLLIVVISVVVLTSPSLALVVFGGIAIWWGPDIATDYVQSQCRSSWTGKVAKELAEARADLASAKIYVAKVEDELADARRQAAQWHVELQAALLRVKQLEQQHGRRGHPAKIGT